tara:strand:+ start:475 stop:1101 length:627 start_codon:yes stop_codon:yes gene_type:complete
MDHKEYKITFSGQTPLIMHSSQTADPTNPFAKALKKITCKRSKTDEDYEAMSQIEYQASLYRDSEEFPNVGLYMPTENVTACLINAGKKIKHGRGSMKAAVTGVLFDNPHGWAIETKYKNYEDMYADKDTWFKKIVNVQSNKIVRTRVIIRDWKFTAKCELENTICDLDMLQEMLNIAGRIIGFGDWRPSNTTPGSYGKFVAHAEEVK